MICLWILKNADLDQWRILWWDPLSLGTTGGRPNETTAFCYCGGLPCMMSCSSWISWLSFPNWAPRFEVQGFPLSWWCHDLPKGLL
jgi:hypothetical protein